jgi:hypothetical protein
LIPSLLKLIKIETSYGRCHKVKFLPGLISFANSTKRTSGNFQMNVSPSPSVHGWSVAALFREHDICRPIEEFEELTSISIQKFMKIENLYSFVKWNLAKYNRIYVSFNNCFKKSDENQIFLSDYQDNIYNTHFPRRLQKRSQNKRWQ